MKLRLEVAVGTTVGRRAEIRRAIRVLELIELAMSAEDGPWDERCEHPGLSWNLKTGPCPYPGCGEHEEAR